ncbi:YhcN/YlaJ family sporulation lipoprotein [Pontibacillus salicampi]|uniref:YhcN/YlaJ family sporulation lipoprotein n=1 Tax=Pontibacillus salicampi TaxID=1449801 RepID=A0ABV6LNJ2_9BACI
MNYKSWMVAAACSASLFISGCGINNNESAMDVDDADQYNSWGYNNGKNMNNGTENERYGMGMNKINTGENDPNSYDNANYTSVKNDNNNNAAADRFGYSRYNEDQVAKSEDEIRYAVINRENVSDLITRMMLQGQGIKDAATLITDAEALIAYTPNGEVNRNEAATVAKKTAMSVLPRYYEVYVTDEEGAHKDLASLSNLTTDDNNYRKSLEKTIEQMRKSPQGEAMYNDETMSKKDKRDLKQKQMSDMQEKSYEMNKDK